MMVGSFCYWSYSLAIGRIVLFGNPWTVNLGFVWNPGGLLGSYGANHQTVRQTLSDRNRSLPPSMRPISEKGARQKNEIPEDPAPG